MKKSFLFLAFMATFVFVSCGCNNNGSEEQNDSAKSECQTKCEKKTDFHTRWARFDSLTLEDQEALLAKRAACFTKRMSNVDCEKKCQKTEDKVVCETKKAECEKSKKEITELWSNYEKMSVAEKKAFFDRVDAEMPKKCCKKEEGKHCDKKEEGKHCSK